MIKYIYLAEFEKDFKALQKRYRTLAEDFETFKKFTIETFYEMNAASTSFLPIEGFCGKNYTANKVRKFACRSLPGRGNQSGIRIIFVWQKETRTVTFVEIYFKGDKPEEDRKRLKTFIDRFEKRGEIKWNILQNLNVLLSSKNFATLLISVIFLETVIMEIR